MTQKLRKHHCFTGLEKLTAAYSSLQYCLHIILSQLKLVNKSGNLNSIMFRGLWFNYLGIQIVVCRLTLSSSVTPVVQTRSMRRAERDLMMVCSTPPVSPSPTSPTSPTLPQVVYHQSHLNRSKSQPNAKSHNLFIYCCRNPHDSCYFSSPKPLSGKY